MNNSTLQIKVQQRLNKLASQDYDNVHCWQVIEAFNKGQIEWCRRQLAGKNQTKEGGNQTTRRIDDLQILLKQIDLVISRTPFGYYESDILPTDYLEFEKVGATATKECCVDPKNLIVYLAEENNTGLYLRDELKKPNFEWAETFCTLVGNKIRIYAADDFDITSAFLMYYRKPIQIEITNCANPYTGNISTVDVICEFKDDIVEVLIDNAAAILAGDIEAFNQYSRLQQNSETNN